MGNGASSGMCIIPGSSKAKTDSTSRVVEIEIREESPTIISESIENLPYYRQLVESQPTQYSEATRTSGKRIRLPSSESDMQKQDSINDEIVDPSLNFHQVEKKLERSRRVSRMESEAVAKLKLLQRMRSVDDVIRDVANNNNTVAPLTRPKTEENCYAPSVPLSPSIVEDSFDLSLLNPDKVEKKLTKNRRMSRTSYNQKLTVRKETLRLKKTSSLVLDRLNHSEVDESDTESIITVA